MYSYIFEIPNLAHTTLKSIKIWLSKSGVLQADWLIKDYNEKATLNFSMPYELWLRILYRLHFIFPHTDINECLVSNGDCGGSCTNTDGSYICTCPEGTLLTAGNQCRGEIIIFH